MEHKIQIKPFKKKEVSKYRIIEITDFSFHTSHKKPTVSFGNKIEQSLKLNRQGRIYSPIENQKITFWEYLEKDEDLIKMIQEEARNGYKVLIKFPDKGIPILAGEDTLGFLKSKNGKRIIRGLAKNKSVI